MALEVRKRGKAKDIHIYLYEDELAALDFLAEHYGAPRSRIIGDLSRREAASVHAAQTEGIENG